MANVFIEESTMQAIGDAIRSKTGKSVDMLPSDMPTEIESIEAGDNHYDTFWDIYQDHGNRTIYTKAFSGRGWKYDVFKPKYPLNLGNITSAGSMFVDNTYISKIDYDLDFSNSADCSYLFSQCLALESIKSIKFNNNIAQSKNNHIFASCVRLKDITIVGTIEFTISFGGCPLTKESILKVFAALSEDITGQTVTFKGSVVDALFKTPDSDKDNGRDSEEWKALKATRQTVDENGDVVSGWNIGLA